MVTTLLTRTSPTSLPGWAEPTYSTQRADRPTHGDKVERAAHELGFELMAWQKHVSDVALEYDPDTGLPAYKTVTVTIPRQNGKTQLILAVMVARSLMWGSKQGIVYGAQNGKDARKKWKEDLLPQVEGSPLSYLIKRAYLSDGNTNLLWDNRSRISIVDNTPTAGHGLTLDLVMLDEAFAHKDDAPETAFVPTMSTRPFAQLWNVSSAGDQSSTYLRRKVDAGRAGVATGKIEGSAYFEWSVPEDEDPYDLPVLAGRFPAWNVTIDEKFIEWAQGELSEGSYRRTIGNQWTETEERLIPAEWWAAASQHGVEADPSTSVFAIDARADRSAAVVTVADVDGNVELVEFRPDVSWLRGWFDEKPERRQRRIVVDRNGPLDGIADDLERSGSQIVRLDSSGVRKSCGAFFDGLSDRKIRVRDNAQITEAVSHAANKTTADSWSWHREAPGGEILMALSMAYAVRPVSSEPLVAWM